MPKSLQEAGTSAFTASVHDVELLEPTAAAVRAAGSALIERYGDVVRY